MFYYEVALLNSPLSPLTYASTVKLQVRLVVQVVVRNRSLQAVVLGSCEKPSFKTTDIVSTFDICFSSNQFKMAQFISNYYFCSLGEALNLFVPFSNEKVVLESNEKIFPNITLSIVQTKALHFLKEQPVSLLFGDTGAGKTEIYMKRFEEVISKGKRVLFLMPEISLTPQMQIRLEEHFGDAVVMWHSKVTKPQKKNYLRKFMMVQLKLLLEHAQHFFYP